MENFQTEMDYYFVKKLKEMWETFRRDVDYFGWWYVGNICVIAKVHIKEAKKAAGYNLEKKLIKNIIWTIVISGIIK